MYFVARLNKTPEIVGAFVDSTIMEGAQSTKGTGNGMYFTFSTSENEVVEMQVALSYTSIDGGRLTFKMGAKPNLNWGVVTPPPSMSTIK